MPTVALVDLNHVDGLMSEASISDIIADDPSGPHVMRLTFDSVTVIIVQDSMTGMCVLITFPHI